MSIYDEWKKSHDFDNKARQQFIAENTLQIGTRVRLNEDIHSEYYLDMPVGEPVLCEGATGTIVDNDDYQYYGIQFNIPNIVYCYYFDDVREFTVIGKPKQKRDAPASQIKQLGLFD